MIVFFWCEGGGCGVICGCCGHLDAWGGVWGAGGTFCLVPLGPVLFLKNFKAFQYILYLFFILIGDLILTVQYNKL